MKLANHTYEWYRTLVEMGDFEVVHGRERFYENSKLHVAFATGSLGLIAYALNSKVYIVLALAFVVSFYGAANARLWLRQVVASSVWETRWRAAAAELERTPEFRSAVGANSVRAWSHENVAEDLAMRTRDPGATTRFYKASVASWAIFHAVVGAMVVIYSLWCFVRWVRYGA